MINLKQQILKTLRADTRKVSKNAKLGRVWCEFSDAFLEARKEFMQRKK